MNDDDVYRAAEQLRESQLSNAQVELFTAQDVADLLLESDVGGVLESLHRLVAAGRLESIAVTTLDPKSDADEYESFAFPA